MIETKFYRAVFLKKSKILKNDKKIKIYFAVK